MNGIKSIVRKAGRTAQVHIPLLQNAGKTAESMLRRVTGKLHDPDLEGLRHIAIPPRALILDIGANRGSAAQSFWTIAPDCQIVCFEPNSAMVRKYLRAVERNGGTVHTVALSDTPGAFPLFMPIYRNVAFDGLASLDKSEASEWLNAKTLFGFNAEKLTISEQLVQVKRLDDFSYEPFFIKIDVQGREASVIRGGAQTIARSLPIIFAESEALDIQDVMTTLAPCGYDYYRYAEHRFHRHESSSSNVYFIPDAKAELIRE